MRRAGTTGWGGWGQRYRSVASRLREDALLRNSAVLMAAAQVGNGCNFLFQFAMMRLLPALEYGTWAAILGVLLVLSIPLEAVRTAVAHGVAEARLQGRSHADIAAWVFRWTVGAGCVGLLVAACIGVAGTLTGIADRFPGGSMAVLGGVLVAAGMVLPVQAGALQGMEWFGRLAVISQVWSVARLVLGVVFVALLAVSAGAALSAHALGLGLSLVLGGRYLVRGLGWPERGRGALSGRLGYLLLSLPALIGFGLLMNADIVLVRIRFDAVPAGLFARAATLARAVAFLPMPVALAVFPRLAVSGEKAARAAGLRAMGLVAALSLVGAVSGWILAGPFWRVFTGAWPSAPERELTRILMLGMAPMGLVFMQMHVLLARRRFASAACIAPMALLYAWVVLRHASGLDAVGWILAGAGTGTATLLAAAAALPFGGRGVGGRVRESRRLHVGSA